MQNFEALRKSTRVNAQIPVRVTSLSPFLQVSEECHTVAVNNHGCGVRVAREMELGLPVLLDELPTGQKATASVASCVPLGTDGKFWIVGLELDNTGNIWGLPSAPSDWVH